jgi:hypothetical protein
MSSEDLTHLAKPTSDATLTILCIKNFEYRTCKNLVLQHVNLETGTVGDLKKLVLGYFLGWRFGSIGYT